MTTHDDVSYRSEGGIARITVTRASRLNAYRNETADALVAALDEAEGDPANRVAILTGEGRAFGAGYDLSTVEPDASPELEDVLGRYFNPLVRRLRSSPLPIIARVNGPCAGAAVGIALACDLVVMGRSAYFYEPFVGIALVPDAGNTQFLTQTLGRIRATGMMLLGDRLPADEALRLGLAWKVVDDAELDAETEQIARKIASLDPGAVTATKQLIAAAADLQLDEQLDLERDAQGERGRSPAMRAAVAAFFAKRG
jgi:2-(1,2-epoxy-1,2-dihydrophenyl)acetyl-CoA isomerase